MRPRDRGDYRGLGEAFRYFKTIRRRIEGDACVDPLGRNPEATQQAYDAWIKKRAGDHGDQAETPPQL